MINIYAYVRAGIPRAPLPDLTTRWRARPERTVAIILYCTRRRRVFSPRQQLQSIFGYYRTRRAFIRHTHAHTGVKTHDGVVNNSRTACVRQRAYGSRDCDLRARRVRRFGAPADSAARRPRRRRIITTITAAGPCVLVVAFAAVHDSLDAFFRFIADVGFSSVFFSSFSSPFSSLFTRRDFARLPGVFTSRRRWMFLSFSPLSPDPADRRSKTRGPF